MDMRIYIPYSDEVSCGELPFAARQLVE